MRKTTAKHNIDSLAALLLFAVFAACVLAVLLTGARAYRDITQRDRDAYNARIAAQYVAQRVRQADSLYGVAVEDFGGVQALVLGAGEEYVTRVYCYDGALMELYCPADGSFGPEDGDKVVEASEMSLSMEDGVLDIVVRTPGGNGEPYRSSRLRLNLRSG